MACKYCGKDRGHTAACPQGQAEALELKKRQEIALKELAELIKDQRENEEGDLDGARAVVADLMDAKLKPRVTVPRQYLDDILKEGLRERPSAYIPTLKVIVGTLGRETFLPEDEDRAVLEVDLDKEQVEPRMTGKEKIFQGIVRLRGPVIPPEKLRVVPPDETEPPIGPPHVPEEGPRPSATV